MSNFPDLNRVKLAPHIDWTKPPGHVLVEQRIFNSLCFNKQLHLYHHFDILTYTINSCSYFISHPIHRLLYSEGRVPRNTLKSIRLAGTHAKLWICYHKDNDIAPDVFIGSANATEMTLHELMIHVTPQQASILIQHFNSIWKAHS
jgi:hypothetical protein